MVESTSCECLYRPPRCTLRCRRWSATAFNTVCGACAPAALSKKIKPFWRAGKAARTWSIGKLGMAQILYTALEFSFGLPLGAEGREVINHSGHNGRTDVSS